MFKQIDRKYLFVILLVTAVIFVFQLIIYPDYKTSVVLVLVCAGIALYLGVDFVASFRQATEKKPEKDHTKGKIVIGDHIQVTQGKNSTTVINTMGNVEKNLGQYQTGTAEDLESTSHLRCIERFVALGVPYETAELFYNDQSIGDFRDLLKTNNQSHLKLLIGDFGSGKSLLVERLFQAAVEDIRNHPESRIPVFLEASIIEEPLDQLILQSASKLGNIKQQGAVIVIDGVDEVDKQKATKILAEARVISELWENVYIVIASRPTFSSYGSDREIVNVPMLSISEITNIVRIVAEKDFDEYQLRTLPQPIFEAVQRPIFALLLGVFFRENSSLSIKSKGELFHYLMERSVGNSGISKSDLFKQLEDLAYRITNQGGKYIPYSEFGDYEEFQKLLSTRIVISHGANIGFALPILQQWFAAQYLISNIVDIEQLTNDYKLLLRWYYPLLIYFDVSTFENISKYLKPITEKHPALSASLIKGTSMVSEYFSDNTSGLTKEIVIERTKLVFNSFAKGLGKAASVLLPMNENNRVGPIAISAGPNYIRLGFFNEPQIGEFIEFSDLKLNHQIVKIITSPVGKHPIWAWKYCLEFLSKELDKLIKARRLICKNGYSYKEMMWKIALNIMGYGELYETEIQIETILEKINNFPKDEKTLELEHYLVDLLHKDELYLKPIWATSDKPVISGGFLWGSFSKEQLKMRSENLLTAALEEYKLIVENWFPAFKESLNTYLLLPAKIEANINPDQSDWHTPGSILQYHFIPLTQSEQSYVEITEKVGFTFWVEEAEAMLRRYEELRPNLFSVYVTEYGLTPEFFGGTPVTNIVYQWLMRDLKAIEWL